MPNNKPFGGIIFGFGPKTSVKKSRDSRRAFTKTQQSAIWDQQKGKCAECHKPLEQRTVTYHHGKAWSKGGKTIVKNGSALCLKCHALKTHGARLKKIDRKRKSTRYKDPAAEISKLMLGGK
jgi:predicted CXXCH cytochrome family protein